MATKEDLKDWVKEALHANGGRATLIEVAKHIWEHRETELRASGDLFYRWQYVMRWAATDLRKAKVMLPVVGAQDRTWQLQPEIV